MTKFADALGNPIASGDIFAYPMKVGSGSPETYISVVMEIDPLVKDANDQWCYKSMVKKNHATVPYPAVHEWTGGTRTTTLQPQWAYQLKHRKLYEGKRQYGDGSFSSENPARIAAVRNVSGVIVITKLVSDELLALAAARAAL